jgi:hypothetical protein
MRPGLFRSGQRAVSRQNFCAGNSHGTRCGTRSTLAVDAVRWSVSAPSAPPWLAVGFAATRIFQSMLHGTRPLDSVVLSPVIATLSAVTVLACLAPARRASRLDPMQAFRTE